MQSETIIIITRAIGLKPKLFTKHWMFLDLARRIKAVKPGVSGCQAARRIALVGRQGAQR